MDAYISDRESVTEPPSLSLSLFPACFFFYFFLPLSLCLSLGAAQFCVSVCALACVLILYPPPPPYSPFSSASHFVPDAILLAAAGAHDTSHEESAHRERLDPYKEEEEEDPERWSSLDIEQQQKIGKTEKKKVGRRDRRRRLAEVGRLISIKVLSDA